MAATEVKVQMQQRRDTASGWTSADPTLLSGELGYETDTGKFKIGDGSTAWSSLDYLRSSIEWTLTANGTTDYIFAGPGFAGTETDPTIYVVRGQYYKFTNAMGAHPFQIQSTQGTSGTAYNDGITNNGVSNGTLTWEVRMDAPSTLYYQCTSHADMNGTIYVLDEGSSVASIDDLGDVDTTTVAPTDGQALLWDNTASKWEPGTVSSGTSLPAAQDGEALIYENGQWVAGPVIGGVDYTSGGGDANYSSVELLLLGNGTNGSTTITDSSTNAYNLNVNGNTQISTLQSKFGGASILFDGSGDYLQLSNQSWMSWGTNEFTIESWFYIDANATNNGNIVSVRPTSGASNSWALTILGDASTTGTGIEWYGKNAYGGTIHDATYIGTISKSTWHHVAVVRETYAIKIYLDGTEVASNTLTATDSYAGNYPLRVGSLNGSDQFFNGHIDDLRITSGVARYTAAFTPPTAELPTTGATTVTIPYSIDKLDDVDTSTVAPTDGQVLAWDNTASKWEPGSLRTLLDIGEYADDTAAGTGGLSSGELYYNTTSSSYVLKT